MDMKSRVARPSSVPGRQPAPVPTQTSKQSRTELPIDRKGKKRQKKGIKWPIILLGLILVVTLSAGVYFWRTKNGVSSQIASDKYQAVFLTNGQVYFGKLAKVHSGYYVLKDVFYLQNKASDKTADDEGQLNSKGDVELIKLGNEVHGPEDYMIIERSQVLFFENLKSDGKVSQTIASYQKG